MRAFTLTLSLAAAFALTAPAKAERQSETVSLRAGEEVSVVLDDGGRPHETARGAAEHLNPFEAAAVWNLTNGVYGEPVGPDSARIVSGENGVPDAPQVLPGTIRIKLVRLGPRATLLVVENGYPGGLAYRASIRAPGPPRATDVCEVMPQRYSFEHWPYRIDHIELSQLRLVSWIEGQRPRCE